VCDDVVEAPAASRCFGEIARVESDVGNAGFRGTPTGGQDRIFGKIGA
jgi:hypothetical protein